VVDVIFAHTCQPTPQLGTKGGRGMALANLETAMKEGVSTNTEID
jgi:hypothetical protein